MENVVILKGKINLATLCLRLCEEMEEHYVDSSYRLKPMPKDEAFEKEVAMDEDVYRALYAAMYGMIDIFHKGNDEIVISTYRNGITIAGLEIESKDLYALCSVENNKFLIQRSRLGIALAFLKQEQVKIEQVYGGERDCIGFAFPNEVEKQYTETASIEFG